ncbi:MAG: DUF2335 domain-containing protein [Planctomycetota bacterium]|nr:DUF2335 domain-containing protein [Planctomycetota bacterium]
MNESDSSPPDQETETESPRPSDISTPSSTTPEQIQQPEVSSPPHLEAIGAGSLISTETSLTVTQSSGPLPPAAELQQYGEINASFPERIVAMAEAQAAHRRAVENRAVDAEIEDNRDMRKWMRRGQRMAFCLAVLFLVAGVWLTLEGHPAVGGIALGTTVVSLAAVFVAGRVPSRKTEEPDHDA